MLAWLPSEEAEGKIMLKKKYSDSPHQLDPTSKLVLQSAAWAAAQRIKDLWLPKGCTKKGFTSPATLRSGSCLLLLMLHCQVPL